MKVSFFVVLIITSFFFRGCFLYNSSNDHSDRRSCLDSDTSSSANVLIDSTLQNISYYESDSDFPISLDRLIGDNKTLPTVSHLISPRYPEIARRVSLDGNVIARIDVNSKGKVQKAIIFRSDAQIFEESVLEAITQWTFKPLVNEGMPQGFVALVPFYFKIK